MGEASHSRIKMGTRLVSADTASGGFSPFVDVAISAMAAMFTFLAVYVAVVPPREAPPLEILTESLPKAAWLRAFEAAIAVTGGEGPYHYLLDSRDELAELNLDFDELNGWIKGTPRTATSREMETPRTLKLDLTVRDRAGRLAGATLTLRITPAAVPFDPEEDGLRFATQEMRLPDAWIGRQYNSAVAILGGIEPYEVDLQGLPAGLSHSLGRIDGVPDDRAVPAGKLSSEHTVSMAVVDQQSAKLTESRRAPRLIREFKLRVHRIEAIEVKGPFPGAGRAGLPFEGAVIAQGGRGRCTWAAATELLENEPEGEFRLLSNLGLQIGSRTGILHGRLRRELISGGQPILVTIPLLVDDEDPETNPIRTHVAMSILPPMRFVKPD
ncbi:MAG: hypothetical protein ABIG68_02170 [Acidobacteriota bacterium]